MQTDQLVKNLTNNFNVAIEHFQSELTKLRTGRAHAGVLDKVMVSAYGVSMPLKQLANVTAPEAQLLQVTPFDMNNLQAISSAIRDDQSLGLNPVDDGKIIRITVPPLTVERRTAIVKLLNQKTEEALISMRNYRHEATKEIDDAKKDKDISEDEWTRIMKQIDALMTDYKNKADELAREKEQEIMKI